MRAAFRSFVCAGLLLATAGSVRGATAEAPAWCADDSGAGSDLEWSDLVCQDDGSFVNTIGRCVGPLGQRLAIEIGRPLAPGSRLTHRANAVLSEGDGALATQRDLGGRGEPASLVRVLPLPPLPIERCSFPASGGPRPGFARRIDRPPRAAAAA